MYVNQVVLGGRLVADVLFTQSETDPNHDRVWGRVACNRPGEGCDFVTFVGWGATARATAKHCKKGKMLLLVGSLRTRSEKREDDTYNNYSEINCATIHFGPDAKNTAPAEAQPASAPSPSMPALTPELLSLLAGALSKAAPPAVACDDIPL